LPIAPGDYNVRFFSNNSLTVLATSAPITVTVPLAALTYSVNPATYIVGQAIAGNTPSSSGGAVTSYSISPSLPTGLSLKHHSGVISSTPTVLSIASPYTVTAANPVGSTAATVTIIVNDASPSALTYSLSSATYSIDQPITDNTPSSGGGPVTSYSIDASLPAGLSFDTVTGGISGTPTVVSPATDYAVTATNSGGSTTAIVNITVQ
jgi:hypothetical protein